MEEARRSGGRRSAHAAACRQRDCRASERGGSGAGRRAPGENAVVYHIGTCAARRPRRGADGKRRQQGTACVLARSGTLWSLFPNTNTNTTVLQKMAGEYTTWTGAATTSLPWCGGTHCYTDACAAPRQAGMAASMQATRCTAMLRQSCTATCTRSHGCSRGLQQGFHFLSDPTV